MNYTQPFLRKVETAQEEQQHQHPQHQPQSGVSYRAAVAAKEFMSQAPKAILSSYIHNSLSLS